MLIYAHYCQVLNDKGVIMEKNEMTESIDNGVGQFAAEASIIIDDLSPLFDLSDYPEEMHELLTECNRRIDEANTKYRVAKYR